MRLGSNTACEEAVSQAIAQPVEQAQQHVQQGLILHADETSWWQNNVKHWLWVAATPLVTVFMINRHRGKEAARQLLGAFEGVLITDRWKPYRVHGGLRQFCWAHLESRVEVEDLLIDGEVLGVRPMAGKCAQITARLISRNQNTAQYY